MRCIVVTLKRSGQPTGAGWAWCELLQGSPGRLGLETVAVPPFMTKTTERASGHLLAGSPHSAAADRPVCGSISAPNEGRSGRPLVSRARGVVEAWRSYRDLRPRTGGTFVPGSSVRRGHILVWRRSRDHEMPDRWTARRARW